jgi:poly(A) polymerase
VEKNLTQAQQAQILTPAVIRIMDALRSAGGEARVVGGAVRDVLMGRKAGDLDLASNLPPPRVMEFLKDSGIKTKPTGLAHGTLTAVIDHVGYEITTLRQDMATDGRHAEVAFTDDWQADAARRDFTFNALYVDAAGKIYDTFNGADDAAAGRVRFIGDARARIREDVLRILRFFRFHAWFGAGVLDADGLAACRALADLMPRLSAERIAREVLKLLQAQNPAPAWRLMVEANITRHFLAEAENLAALEQLIAREKQFDEPPQALTRLAALLPQDAKIAAAVAKRLKLANNDSKRLEILAALPALLAADASPQGLRRLLYRYGADNGRAAIFLNGQNIAELLPVVAAWNNPVFPIKGEDIVRLGLPAGPQVGIILREVEQQWIVSDFALDRDACLALAKGHGKNH